MSKPRQVRGTSELRDFAYATLPEAIAQLEEARKRFGDEATVDLYEQYGNTYIQVEYMRDETTEEARVRKVAKERHEQWDKEQYLKLKKKYGDE